MNKFEAFLKALLKSLFEIHPYDEKTSKQSFEIIKNAQTKNKEKGESNG